MEWYNLSKDISRKEAKQILKYMSEIIDRYGYVSLADFYDLKGSKVCKYTDNKKVWRSLTGAEVSLIRRHGRHRIKLPAFDEIL